MKRYLVYINLWFLLISGNAFAQTNLVPMDFGTGLRFSSLWNFSLTIGNIEHSEFYIEISVSEQGGKNLFKAESERMALSQGTHVYSSVNLESLKPFQFSFIERSFSKFIGTSDPEFPDGNYSIQYKVFGKKSGGDNWEELTRVDNNRSIFNYLNIMLISVHDGDTIQEKNPFFIWTPIEANRVFSGDGDGSSAFTYSIRICQILPGQTKEIALLGNSPVFEKNDILISNQLYPVEASILEDNASYVWQVSAFKQGQLASKSDVWVFHYSDEKRKKNGQFVWMNSSVGQSFSTVSDGILCFAYNEMNSLKEGEMIVGEIYTEWGQKIVELKSLTIPKKSGANMIKINLCGENVLLANGNYLLIIFDAKGQKYFLNFSNQTLDCNE